MSKQGIRSSPMRVRLVAYTADPLSIVASSARTCYSRRVIYPEEVTPSLRERLSRELLSSGHITPYQHPTFVFAIENVSRHAVWSLLHSHPFYNSEQSSQRYNILKVPDVYTPGFKSEKCMRLYLDAVKIAWDAYFEIMRTLHPVLLEQYEPIARIKGLSREEMNREAERKAAESARYVLPVAAHTHLYHTINGMTLIRYARWCLDCDTPKEGQELLTLMRDEIRRVDPGFAEIIPIPSGEKTVDRPMISRGDQFTREFDSILEGKVSKLAGYSPEDESVILDWLREVHGIPSESDIDMDALLHRGLKYEYPLFRVFSHVCYTFKKCMSHAADSQEERHREVNASRPLLSLMHTSKPDAVTPESISSIHEAETLFHDVMKTLWETKEALLNDGEDPKDACYILPNATKIRYTESGTYLAMRSKWRLRTCFLAQREIFDASMQELEQVRRVHPLLGKYISPRCVSPIQGEDSREGFPCPEGKRWCGVKVWLNFPRVKRIF